MAMAATDLGNGSNAGLSSIAGAIHSENGVMEKCESGVDDVICVTEPRGSSGRVALTRRATRSH
jgi:hypothetical protein